MKVAAAVPVQVSTLGEILAQQAVLSLFYGWVINECCARVAEPFTYRAARACSPGSGGR
jgi:hypothetical protein